MAVDDPTDFSMQSSSTTTTIASGSTGSVGVTFTSLTGFNGSVNVGCTVPLGLICTPAVKSLPLNGIATTTVSINTVNTTTSAENRSSGTSLFEAGAGPAPVCLLFFVLPRRRRLGRAMLSGLVMAVVLSGAGCGGSSATKPTGLITVSTDAKPGTYAAVISATGSNGIVNDVPVTVIVQ